MKNDVTHHFRVDFCNKSRGYRLFLILNII